MRAGGRKKERRGRLSLLRASFRGWRGREATPGGWLAEGGRRAARAGSLARATGLELSPVLRIVALFQIAVAASILLIARTRRAPAGASAGGGAAAAPPPQPLGQWFLQLESCELVKSTEQQLAPTVQRSLTQTGSDSGPSAMPLSPGTRLPDCIRCVAMRRCLPHHPALGSTQSSFLREGQKGAS